MDFACNSMPVWYRLGMTLDDYLNKQDQKISYAAFGERIGVSQAAVSRYVTGLRFPSPEIIRRIEDASGNAVSFSDILHGFEEAKKARNAKASENAA